MSISSPSRSQRLEALRAEVSAIAVEARDGGACLPFGIGAVDDRLAAGGLPFRALHEVAGETASMGDDAASTLFAAGIAARSSPTRTILWIMAKSDLFAPGLALVGLTPARLLQVEARRDEDALAVMEEGLRHGGIAVVVGEVARVGMTATRRLQLAAEEGGSMALLLRRWRRAAQDPLAEPSVAVTRWRIGCAPSLALPVAGVGRPRWNVALVRQRGGEPHQWMLEGCDAQGRLALPAEPRDRSAAPVRRARRQAA